MSVSVKGPRLQKLQIASGKWVSKPLKFFFPKKNRYQARSAQLQVDTPHFAHFAYQRCFAWHGRVRRIRQADATEESPNSETSEAGVRVWSAKLGKLWVMNQQKSGGTGIF